MFCLIRLCATYKSDSYTRPFYQGSAKSLSDWRSRRRFLVKGVLLFSLPVSQPLLTKEPKASFFFNGQREAGEKESLSTYATVGDNVNPRRAQLRSEDAPQNGLHP
jgi:hypothetical protein